RNFPASPDLEQAKPVYESLPGGKSAIADVRSFSDLPEPAKQYVRYIEELAGIPVGWISVGPDREALFRRGETK
ncbi:MAG: adenylosuccinate synthetase, partial [Deltaproteobacteria bacterium]|nr:adenylosuccinate synthetase [Deltaproteobacteria bacterium]